MNTKRKATLIISSLFFLSTTAFLRGLPLSQLSYPNASKIGLETVCQLVSDLTVVGIGALFFLIYAK